MADEEKAELLNVSSSTGEATLLASRPRAMIVINRITPGSRPKCFALLLVVLLVYLGVMWRHHRTAPPAFVDGAFFSLMQIQAWVLTVNMLSIAAIFVEHSAMCSADFDPVDTSSLYANNRHTVLRGTRPPLASLASLVSYFLFFGLRDTAFRGHPGYKAGEAIFLAGNEQLERTNSDTDILFRQDSNFLYMTGYNVPECALAVDIDSGSAVLFVPRKSRSELIFDGGIEDFDRLPLLFFGPFVVC